MSSTTHITKWNYKDFIAQTYKKNSVNALINRADEDVTSSDINMPLYLTKEDMEKALLFVHGTKRQEIIDELDNMDSEEDRQEYVENLMRMEIDHRLYADMEQYGCVMDLTRDNAHGLEVDSELLAKAHYSTDNLSLLDKSLGGYKVYTFNLFYYTNREIRLLWKSVIKTGDNFHAINNMLGFDISVFPDRESTSIAYRMQAGFGTFMSAIFNINNEKREIYTSRNCGFDMIQLCMRRNEPFKRCYSAFCTANYEIGILGPASFLDLYSPKLLKNHFVLLRNIALLYLSTHSRKHNLNDGEIMQKELVIYASIGHSCHDALAKAINLESSDKHKKPLPHGFILLIKNVRFIIKNTFISEAFVFRIHPKNPTRKYHKRKPERLTILRRHDYKRVYSVYEIVYDRVLQSNNLSECQYARPDYEIMKKSQSDYVVFMGLHFPDHTVTYALCMSQNVAVAQDASFDRNIKSYMNGINVLLMIRECDKEDKNKQETLAKLFDEKKF